MATINLLPRKVFEIVTDHDGIITGQFGTWALKRFCDKQKYSLKEASEKLGDPGLSEIVEYLLCAIEYSARQEGKPFSYTDVHVCGWIDELGGMSNETFVKLFNHSASEDKNEKKTETQEVN